MTNTGAVIFWAIYLALLITAGVVVLA